MPTYEYECSKCDNHWEEVQRITEPPVLVCPKCHKKTAQRQISGGSFILKGGGWYAEGYSSSKPAKAEANGATTTEAKSTESKSEGPAKKDSVAPAPAKESKSSSAAPGSGTSSSGTKPSGNTKD